MVRTCPRDALRRSGTRAHRCTRPADAPHAATGGARTRPASLLALEPHRLIAHRTLELFLLLPLPFSLRRPLTLLLLAPPRLFPHAFLLLELRLVLKSRKRKKNRLEKGGDRDEEPKAYRLGARPSLVEDEPRDLLGLG
jgi:hypothetical protein